MLGCGLPHERGVVDQTVLWGLMLCLQSPYIQQERVTEGFLSLTCKAYMYTYTVAVLQ